jgi:hypothetical protein
MRTRTIEYGSEYFKLHPSGYIERTDGHARPSHKWRVVGAVTRNNFGHVVRRYSLDEILRDPSAIPWRHKNGTQRTFLCDYDHGTLREWRSPGHRIR